MTHTETHNYRRLFAENVPLLDVRAPVEFIHGSFPDAVNAPLLDDIQRDAIGTAYKQEGKEVAIALGRRLATPQVQAERMSLWLEFLRQHPDGVLFCLRGGMRSQIAQEWLHDAGHAFPRVMGGYKAMRSYLLDSVAPSCESSNLFVLSGRTGTGKTHLLPRLPHHIDLEGLAGHRGSSFGKRVTAQPTQTNFEHTLAIDLLRSSIDKRRCVAVEDESRLIGRRSILPALFDQMNRSPMVVLEAPKAFRVKQIVDDYVKKSSDEFKEKYGEEAGWEHFSDALKTSLHNIRKRLGDERYERLALTLQEAIVAFREAGDLDGFRSVIGTLLDQYYDPMYDYQLEKKTDRVAFRGEADAIVEWVQENWA